MLEHLCNGAKVPALVCGKLASCRQVNDVKGIRSNDGWIHVSIVKQVTNNLGTDKEERRVLKTTPPGKAQMILLAKKTRKGRPVRKNKHHAHTHTHARTHTCFQGLNLKQPNIPWLDAEKKKIRTELTITTMKEQTQKVKTTDLKSIAKGFRASFVHISWQQTGCCHPRALLLIFT